MIKVVSTDNLKEEIYKSGQSISGFAQSIGVSRSAMSKIIRNSTISAKTAKKISNYFDSEFEKFFLII